MNKTKLIVSVLACGVPVFLIPALSGEKMPMTELEAFIVEETALEDSNSLLPTDRTVSTVFLDDMTLLEIPRAVLVLSPETMDLFQIQDFGDLEKVGAGTERYNFYGIAGSPVVRGWIGGAFYNGMLRAHQRNAMPTSFGSLEALNVVKGPAPAHLIPTHVGGYVDMVPKSPYFDTFRGSVEVTASSTGLVRGQVDLGAPLLLGETPSAYRLSVTSQAGEGSYDGVRNDFISVYGAVKMKLSEATRIFAGAEYFDFQSNENSGWNRPTQALFDHGEYVVGEPLSLVRSGAPDYADRNLIDAMTYGYAPLVNDNLQDFRALVVPTAMIDAAVVDGRITEAQRSLLKDMRDPAVRAATYAGLPDDLVQTSDGYLYTADYFMAGGSALTAPLRGREVLADGRDFADSRNLMTFFDLIHTPNGRLTVENKVLVEFVETDKRSSYGYSFRSEQKIFDDRFAVTYRLLDTGTWRLRVTSGTQLRHTQALQLEDYWTEPFARRDLSTGEINPNTVLLSGAQRDPLIGGGNYWSGGQPVTRIEPSAVESTLTQLGFFAVGSLDVTTWFSLLASARQDQARYSARVPETALNGLPGPAGNVGEVTSDSLSLNPVLKLTPDLSLYGAWQASTTYHPTQGGAVIGEQNFGDGTLREVGVKWALPTQRLFLGAALYEWEQTAFSDRTGITAPYRSVGFELEATWEVTPSFILMAAFSERETRRLAPLSFRTMPFAFVDPTGAGNDATGVALEGGALLTQFSDAFGGFTPEGGSPSGNPRLVVPGAPETLSKFQAIWRLPAGFTLAGGLVHRGAFWHNFDRTLRHRDAVLWNASLGYRAGDWELLLRVENLTDTDYFIGAEPDFGANTLVTKGPGREASLKLKYYF